MNIPHTGKPSPAAHLVAAFACLLGSCSQPSTWPDYRVLDEEAYYALRVELSDKVPSFAGLYASQSPLTEGVPTVLLVREASESERKVLREELGPDVILKPTASFVFTELYSMHEASRSQLDAIVPPGGHGISDMDNAILVITRDDQGTESVRTVWQDLDHPQDALKVVQEGYIGH